MPKRSVVISSNGPLLADRSQGLNVLRTIRAAYREPAIVGRDASAAAAVALNGENGPIESEAVENT